MKIFDVSMTIHPEIQVYKNKPEKKPVFSTASDFETGSSYETNLTMNLHTGTHMDFELHMKPNGKTSDTLELSDLIREVKVFDLTKVKDAIDVADIKDLDIKANDFVLFKTQNSFEETFNFKFIYLNAAASTYLAARKVAGIGIDALGVERDQAGHPTHKTLFNANVIIIEGLRLRDVTTGAYMMYALPLKIANVDALPMRIVLIQN